MKNWYIESKEETVKAFSSDMENGLSDEQALRLLQSHGKNKLKEKEKKTVMQRFFAQLKDFMVVVLLIAAFVSLVVEIVESHGKDINPAEPLIIIAIVILNAVLGVAQEQKAEASLDALQKMSSPLSKVKRGGEIKVIPSEDIVPGDIVLLEAGDFVPADGRLTVCAAFKCDESALTGESLPVEKNADANIDVTCPLGDRINMVFSGCSATYGRAEFVVTATGMHTEMGSIAGMLANEDEQPTPLQKQLAQLGKTLGMVALIVCVIIFIFGAFVTKDWLSTFMTAVSLAVAAIPEGLTTIVTVVLALGVQRMVKKKAIIKKLPAVETLGGASVICSDKTGTLTVNRMTVVRAWSYEDNALRSIDSVDPASDKSIVRLLELASLCCDAKIETGDNGEVTEIGDPTETAIVSALMSVGQSKVELEKSYRRVSEIPFDSERKLMTTVHESGSGYISITKGAPDAIISRCQKADRDRIMAVYDSLGRDALRVLAVAYRKFSKSPESADCEHLENNLTFLGLIGMIDPPRDEARAAIKTCHEAGIRTVMITGDHITTASAIARDLGILGEGESAISGAELAEMSDADLYSNIRKYSVYARVTPADKIRIVKAWQEAGEVVAMTGDGVNDAPALKAADIGCAMGITGTDVAKGASDLILTDDNFATIVSAVKEGRGIYDNIQKSVRFLLSCNLGEIVAVFVCMLIFKASPLAAMHLLLINLITDSFPALALGVEPKEEDLMRRRPKAKDEGILNRSTAIRTGIQGLIIGILTVIAFSIGYALCDGDTDAKLAIASTMAFGTLSFSQLMHVLTIRTSGTVFSKSFVSNKPMLYALAGSAAVTLLAMLLPPFMKLFSFVSLTGTMWLWVILLALCPIVVSEIWKFADKLYNKYTS